MPTKQISLKENIQRILNELHSEKFMRFFIVGISAYVIDTMVLYLLQKTIFSHDDSQIFGLIYTSKLFSSTIGLSVSFMLNRYWSFKATHKSAYGQAAKMLAVFIMNIFVSAVIYTTYFELLKLQSLAELGDLAIPLANAATTGTMMISNFFIYKLVVFK